MSTGYPDSHVPLIDQALGLVLDSQDGPRVLLEAMAYAVFSGGKRIRPVLTLLSCESVGGSPAEALPSACAVELIHSYSLVHDDLPIMDDDDFRRAKPTCHKKFGEDVALLAGDALLAEAFYLVSQEQMGEPSVVLGVLKELSRAASVRGMVGGQMADVQASAGRGSPADLGYIHSHKTGALIVASAKIGALIGGADEDQLGLVGNYAGHLGLAFQIADDILDVAGQPEVVGRALGSDAAAQKLTYPGAHGLEESRRMLWREVEMAKSCLREPLVKIEDLSSLADFVAGRDL